MDRGYSTDQVLTNLLQAPLELIRVTVPEGLTRLEIAAVFQGTGMADSARFVELSGDDALVAELGIAASSLEGYLFPETYFLPPDIEEDAEEDTNIGPCLSQAPTRS